MASIPRFTNTTPIGEVVDALRDLDPAGRELFYQYLIEALERAATGGSRAQDVRVELVEPHQEVATAEATENGGDPDIVDVDESVGGGDTGEADDGEEEEETDEAEDEEPAPSYGPRPRHPSDLQFYELLAKGAIVPGNSLMVPSENNPGVIATMTYVDRSQRVSRWNMTCPMLNINGVVSGTGPKAWITALLAQGFPAPPISTWARGVRVMANGQDIGGIADLKVQYG